MAVSLDKHGRVEVNESLIVSINRSFLVEHEFNKRPVSAFKGIVPIGRNLNKEKADVYEAAIEENDAFWLGFEAKNEHVFAIIPCLDNHQAITGKSCESPILEFDPPNFLIVPDQPWFDCVFDQNEGFCQLVPEFPTSASKKGRAAVKEIRLLIYRLDVKPDKVKSANTYKPNPLYSEGTEDSESIHPSHIWNRRSLADTPIQSLPIADLIFQIVDREMFQTNTGIILPSASFDNKQNKLPHNPFE